METRKEVGDRYVLQDEIIRAGIEGGCSVRLPFHYGVHQDRNSCSRFAEILDQSNPTSSSGMASILRPEVELHDDRAKSSFADRSKSCLEGVGYFDLVSELLKSSLQLNTNCRFVIHEKYRIHRAPKWATRGFPQSQGWLGSMRREVNSNGLPLGFVLPPSGSTVTKTASI